MQRARELGAGEYLARQVGNTVYLIAFGEYPNNRYEIELEAARDQTESKEGLAVISPSRFQLTYAELRGKILAVPTRFAVSASLSSPEPIESVTVYDVRGEHHIKVEQAPDFKLERELKKLRGEKGIKYEKLSAGLSSLVHEYETVGANTAVVNSSRVAMTPLFIPRDGGTPETIIFIRCDENADIDLPGVNINSQKGELRTAKVSLDALGILSRHNQVQRLTSSIKLKPLNDVAAARTQLNNFRRMNDSNLTGKNVIIGIVDTGIDSSHQCFDKRILSIWDQRIEGHGWGEKDYGTVLTGELLAASSDIGGHGTHVAGIAAGRDAQFGGVAPDAELIIVKTDFIDAHVRDGIEYIFTEAEKLNKPAVVNLSLGGHINAHDGTDELSDWINRHTGEGKIVVTAAGNEGNADIHAAADIAPGETAEIGCRIFLTARQAPPVVIFSGWYAAAGSCEISVRPPDGGETPFQPVINNSDATRSYVVEGMLITLTTPPATASLNGDHGFELKIQTGSRELQTGRWHIIIRNTGAENVKVDIWSAVPENFNEAVFRAPFIGDDLKIGAPGCAEKAITVAAFTTRHKWTDINGLNRILSGLIPDQISSFSSPGPTRGGRHLKPDIAAPGEMIASALSGQLKRSNPDFLVSANYVLSSGTSMACPFITGICALLLEQDPTLTPDDIKRFLHSKGQIANQFAVEHDNRWGFGLVTF